MVPMCLLGSGAFFLQGVPKIRSCNNFMYYNFWSKLYFYMKFLEDVYFSIEYMYSEFQQLACPFCFLSHCVAVAAWSGIQRVDPQMIHFFITWCAGASSTPKQYFFSLGSWKKIIPGIHPKQIIIPTPFHSKAFVRLYKFETSWALLGRL